jgi:hypothetical protein
MALSRRLVFTLLSCMGFVSLAMRYPESHEIGIDSFAIHTLAQSILSEGRAPWVLSPISYFGWFPASYPAAGPFALASLAALSAIPVEGAILLSSMVLGLVGILTSFVMAREFRNDARFSLCVAFFYAFAPRFLAFNLWQASTRNFFMALLPLFIWALLRFYRERKPQDLVLIGTSLLTLAAAHRLAAITVLMAIAFLFAIVLVIVLRIVRRMRPGIVLRISHIGITRWMALAASLGMGVTFLAATNVLSQYKVGELASGATLPIEVLNLGISITRSVGLAAPLALIGLIYSPWLRGPGLREIFATVGLITLVPTLLLRDYTGFYILPFLAVFAAYGLLGVSRRLGKHPRFLRSAYAMTIVAVVALSGGVLSYEVAHTPPLSPATYDLGLYSSRAAMGNSVVCNELLLCSRLAAIGKVRVIPTAIGSSGYPSPEVLIFRYYTGDDILQRIVRVPIEDLSINLDAFWTVEGINPSGDYISIVQSPVDGIPPALTARYRPSLYLETSAGFGLFYDEIGLPHPSLLANSIHQSSYAVYRDGVETLWWIP